MDEAPLYGHYQARSLMVCAPGAPGVALSQSRCGKPEALFFAKVDGFVL